MTKKFRRLFGAVDRDGLTLPPDVLEARNAGQRIATALEQLALPRPAAEVFVETVTAVLHSDHPGGVDITPVTTHAAEQAEYESRVALLRAARERAEQQMVSAVHDFADVIIIEHIAAAGARLWDEVTKCVQQLGDTNVSAPDDLLRAKDPVRRAWLQLDDLAGRYSRLREALSDVPAQEVEHDAAGDHSEFESGMCTVQGYGWKTMAHVPAPSRPWPSEPRAKLAWLVRNGHRPWWPTAVNRDRAWLSSHKDEFEQQQERQRRHRAAAGWRTSHGVVGSAILG
jgi:hypothetical protein